MTDDRTEVYRDTAGGWRWRRLAGNGEIIADSGEAYTRRGCPMAGDPVLMEWRAGRKVGRTIYTMVAGDPDGNGWLIGVMDTPELTAAAIDAHNEWLKGQPGHGT